MRSLWTHVVPVWVFSAVGIILVSIGVSEDRRVAAMVAVLAASVLMSFVLQVVAYQPGGLVSRLSWAAAGSVALAAVGAVLFLIQTVVE